MRVNKCHKLKLMISCIAILTGVAQAVCDVICWKVQLEFHNRIVTI